MAKKENQCWLPDKYKISFEIIENQINFIKNYYLSIVQPINSNNTNNEHIVEYTSIFENINNAKSQLNSMMDKLQSLEITINNNLKSKKINAFKNFIIRFFTFGKINRNKNIESEISTFKSDCQKLKDKSKDIVQKLDNETNEFLFNIGQKHILLAKQLKEYEVQNIEKENKNQEYQKEINELQQELEIKNQEYQKEINELQQENQEMHEFISTENKKFINEYIVLKDNIKDLEQKIKNSNEKEEPEEKKVLTDSGNESDSKPSNFNKTRINATVPNQKKISTGILNFLNIK